MDANLQTVDFVRADGGSTDGLVPVSAHTRNLSPDEAAVVRQAATFPDVHYVFFRRFSDGRSSQPAAFVVDNEDEHLDNDRLAKLHNDLWLHGVAPLIYVSWPTRIDVLSCARGPDFWQADQLEYHPAEQIETASSIAGQLAKRRRFSAFRLADGTFWEDPQNHSLANHEKAAHESLIQAVVETDQALDGESEPVLRRLLLLMVLIKYLEDRKVFRTPGWFGRFHKGAREFFDVLKSGNPDSVLRLLKTLEERFNGDVFALPTDTKLTKKSLKHFARLVEAKTRSQQRYLWEQFSFSHLPVEVISHLYQRFVKGSTAVYTPPFLASLLLDYAMPYEKLTGKERILDPACGSGVFLVGAYRRLINVHRAKRKTAQLNVSKLKSILKKQIFGVETDANAIDLTAFSLALAMCDSLQPNVIWNELQFDPLRGHNLIEADFFEASDGYSDKGSLGTFDIVVGNPPFESEFTEPAKRVDNSRIADRGLIPDRQIAYLFLDIASQIVNEEGTLCLIQPSGFLYNLNSHPFRAGVAKTRRLRVILDFTSVRGLYEGADPKTVAILMSRESDLPISHLTFRRTYETTQRIGFELDHYDRNQLQVDDLVANPRVARANLLGGGRLASIATRFGKMRTLRQFIANKQWLMGEGFIVGNKKNRADYLVGQTFLPTKAFKDIGFDPNCLTTVKETHFEGPRQSELYEPPLVLIKEHESLPIAFWNESPLAYRDKIVGIHAPATDRTKLRKLYTTLVNHRRTLRFAVALNGSQALVGKATALLKSDIEAMPFPDDESKLDFTFWEEALADDTLTHFAQFVRLGQKSSLLKNMADVSAINAYSSLFCKMLGSIYDNLRADDPVFLDGLVCQPFYFGDEPGIEWLGPDCGEQLKQLVFDESRESLRTIRVVRYYHENVIFIVKPDRLRYWIKSTAIRDADDTLTDLQHQGY